jgi:AcrR family transcriptional regulator
MNPATKTKPSTTDRVLRADARRNREAVLVAARRAFAEGGSTCQMDDIARTAGVGVGTVYRHFPNKEALLDALIATRFETLAEETAKALERDDPWEAFCDLMRFSAKLQADDRGLSEMLASRPLVGEAAAAKSGLVDLSDKLMRKAQKAGDGSLSAMNWERFLEVMLDGMRAPGSAKLPPPRARLNQPR